MKKNRPRALLVDADGVIQTSPPNFITALRSLPPKDEDAEDFLAEVFAAEKPCLVGAANFPTVLSAVLQRWHVDVSLESVLSLWENIHRFEAGLDLIEQTRAKGIPCFLATNQQAQRADYMRTTLGYDALFDHSYYSCELGSAKPDTAFFQSVIADLKLPPDQVLFIDDKEPNLAAAASCGLQTRHFALNNLADPAQTFGAILQQAQFITS
jgi:putative hydrolase of the HAD superfamily